MTAWWSCIPSPMLAIATLTTMPLVASGDPFTPIGTGDDAPSLVDVIAAMTLVDPAEAGEFYDAGYLAKLREGLTVLNLLWLPIAIDLQEVGSVRARLVAGRAWN